MSWQKVFRGERGVVVVYVAICIVVLIGMAALAIDIGQLYVGRQRAQNVCDATALSGVQELALHYGQGGATEAYARQAAGDCAAGNNTVSVEAWKVLVPPAGPDEGVEVSFPTTVTDDAGNTISVSPYEAITTKGCVHVNYGFARIFGFEGKNVSASATAMLKGADTVGGNPVAPPAVSDKTIFPNPDEGWPGIKLGEPLTLKFDNWQSDFLGSGNFGYLDPSDLGAPKTATVKDMLAGDVRGNITLTDPPNYAHTAPGNKVGQTSHGMRDRFGKETDPDYQSPETDATAWGTWQGSYNEGTETYEDFTWRIMIVPVVHEEIINGRKEVAIVGMAGFFIDSITVEQGGLKEITGRFIQGIAVGDEIRWIFPTGDTPTTPNLFIAPRLIS
ncbi:MAG TPA: Tad domain-containing protein [Armatimonadota bacterium]|nr:Tad domain-containing protein [Armatimonadota bacterium]